MTVAHAKHASGFDELEDHGKEFRSFRSEGSIRGHSERDEKSVVSRLNYGLNVRVSILYLYRGAWDVCLRMMRSASRALPFHYRQLRAL